MKSFSRSTTVHRVAKNAFLLAPASYVCSSEAACGAAAYVAFARTATRLISRRHDTYRRGPSTSMATGRETRTRQDERGREGRCTWAIVSGHLADPGDPNMCRYHHHDAAPLEVRGLERVGSPGRQGREQRRRPRLRRSADGGRPRGPRVLDATRVDHAPSKHPAVDPRRAVVLDFGADSLQPSKKSLVIRCLAACKTLAIQLPEDKNFASSVLLGAALAPSMHW